eukprot:GHVP01003385.1.p1 GENE.GHVP01003385.1~~GHVP01003385.1.p1  ORF type:complete len:149 (+),score=16.30 GHVP01003385.1:1162-1608(+)
MVGVVFDAPNRLVTTIHGAFPVFTSDHLALVGTVDVDNGGSSTEDLRKALGGQIDANPKLASILLRFEDLWRSGNPGEASGFSHRLNLTDKTPVFCGLRRTAENEKKTIEAEVQAMLDLGVIRPSKSPCGSTVVLVKKKHGKWRFCIG